ncbi:hypothetical protein P7K49_024941 [Saguinus oedipus]|uniref:Uncharacterized protein n=1 Tax=Saguinus oedipus TaxID=9490 RepID=A0ABQ9UFP4_SAGOE|nr:hypothetical protein P7K49_024941 [Saguinus oedipus]
MVKDMSVSPSKSSESLALERHSLQYVCTQLDSSSSSPVILVNPGHLATPCGDLDCVCPPGKARSPVLCVEDLAAMEIKPIRKEDSDKAYSRTVLASESNYRQQN